MTECLPGAGRPFTAERRKWSDGRWKPSKTSTATHGPMRTWSFTSSVPRATSPAWWTPSSTSTCRPSLKPHSPGTPRRRWSLRRRVRAARRGEIIGSYVLMRQWDAPANAARVHGHSSRLARPWPGPVLCRVHAATPARRRPRGGHAPRGRPQPAGVRLYREVGFVDVGELQHLARRLTVTREAASS